MNARARVFATARGEAVDCFAATPYNGNFAIRLSGAKLGDCYTNGKALAQAQIAAHELLGQDVVVAQSDQYYIAEGLGVKTRLHEDALPDFVGPAISSLKEAASLKAIDPYKDGRCYVYIEAVGLLHQHFGGEVAVRAPGAGAFSIAGHLLGVNEFITELAIAQAEEDEDAEQYLHALMEVAYESHYRYCEACVRAGASIVQAADSLASLDMISPAIYEKYAFPYEKRFFERINALKGEFEFLTLLHICGDNTRVAPLLMQTGCDILEVDYKVDLAHYKQLAGGKLCLMGNLNPTGALLHGTEQDVAAETLRAIQAAGSGGRLYLGSGCEVAVQTPLNNLRALVNTSHAHAPQHS